MNARKQGFTLVELLVVIAIIALLSAILVPLTSKGTVAAKKKKAALEADALVVAVTRYHEDHHFMPVTSSKKLGDDQWVQTSDKEWLAVLQGNNAMKANYLTVKMNDEGVFLDPWGKAYQVGMDRNLDGRVDSGSGLKGASKPVVAVSGGPDGKFGTDDDISTSD